MRKIFINIILLVLIFSPVALIHGAGLVACDGVDQKCDFKALIALVQTVLEFLLRLGVSLAAGASLADAVRSANLAAGIDAVVRHVQLPATGSFDPVYRSVQPSVGNAGRSPICLVSTKPTRVRNVLAVIRLSELPGGIKHFA